MAQRIAFTDIDVSADGWIRCSVTREDEVDELRIELPYSFTPSNDLIASTLSALCGQAFEDIQIDLPIGPNLVKVIESQNKAKLTHARGADVRRSTGMTSALNFSGGFDSLAARLLTPDSALVSLDFGGRFSRERGAFTLFSPYTFRTNLVDLKLNSYSWTFMGIGSILLRDELKLRSYSFGSIQAGALPRMFSRRMNQREMGISTLNSLNTVLENPVLGLSEIGAIGLVAQTSPELLVDTLVSVALPDEDKYRRKYQMIQAVAEDLRLPIKLPEPETGPSLPRWGDSFARDLASLTVAKKLGPDVVVASYEQGLPQNALDNLNSVNLDFMERFNPQAYGGVKPSTVARWYAVLLQQGIVPYERQDWFDAAKTMKLLRNEL